MYASVFKQGFWPEGIGSTDKTPVFVVGLMRSGSTLVETVSKDKNTFLLLLAVLLAVLLLLLLLLAVSCFSCCLLFHWLCCVQ
jgi:hypothetical protein